ncbi:GxGYxYP domain-containing protein [Thermogemmatispora onikobensis]|uniref:GxGYxYP domain-containing protein n=1 Tax=Thermogemmatispora onikobensis TaxID=732234 RepID=UPI0008534825|nr:GxGYxYP domain-containing protein [Thermogemmatispora onikobensis]
MDAERGAASSSLDWPATAFFPHWQVPQNLVVADLRDASFAIKLAASTLAGLVNVPQPQLYLATYEDDLFWLQAAIAPWPVLLERLEGQGEILLRELIARFQTRIAGFIVYDPRRPASVNVATTLAGIQRGVVAAPELLPLLQQAAGEKPVLLDLRLSHWPSEYLAYRWASAASARQRSRRSLAGMNPAIASGLRSFLVATRTFVHWLDSRLWQPFTGQQRQLLEELLAELLPGSVHLGWFPDEGSGVTLASERTVAVLASDHCSNLEVWNALQPPELINHLQALAQRYRRQQDERPLPALEPRVYLSLTISDGDNLQYTQHRLLHLWRDPARGRLPLGWTIAPALLEAAPALAAYYLETASPQDELIAGPSGAAYIFPSRWPATQLPAFLEHSQRLLSGMGLSLLQVLDGDWRQQLGLPLPTSMRMSSAAGQRAFIEALQPAGLRGLLTGAGGLTLSYKKVRGLPVYHNLGLVSSRSQLVQLVRGLQAIHRRRPLFLQLYVLAWRLTPTVLWEALQDLGEIVSPVTPGQLLQLIAQQGEGAES